MTQKKCVKSLRISIKEMGQNEVSRKELAGVRIDICSLREALHKIEHYLASEGLHAVETVSMKTVVTAGEDEQVRQCLEDMDLVIPSG